jgi:hypothetical protein
MKLLQSPINKVILLVLISIVVFTGWEAGIENYDLKLLVGTTNLTVGTIKEGTNVEIESTNLQDEPYRLKVQTIIQGRKGSYPQEIGSLLQPFVIVLSWQIFLFFVLNLKSAILSLGMNMLVFILLQVLFLALLTGYYSSDMQKFLYEVMMDSFYVVAIILVIKDNMLFPVFRKQK